MKLKTRTNQPVYYKLPVSSNIEQLSDGLLNSLKVGDVVQKKTGNQKHCYIVTYKEEGKGICLSYFDGSGYMETISYDYTAGHWVYNSKDVTQAITEDGVEDFIENAESGTIQDVLGLDDNGNLVKQEGTIKKIYCHPISIIAGSGDYNDTRLIVLVFNNVSTPYTKDNVFALFSSFDGRLSMNGFIKYSSRVYDASYFAGGNIVCIDITSLTLFAISLTDILNDTNIVVTDSPNAIN